MDRDEHREAQARLEADYLRGAIDADEYARLRSRLHETVQIQASGDPVTGVRLASWGRRAAAWFVDVLVTIGVIVISFLWAASTEDPVTGELSGLGAVVILLGFLVFPVLYPWLMIGRWGQTLGKMAVGERVVRGEDAGRVGYARALGRVASAWLLGILVLPLLVAYLWPLWDKRNQSLYDKMANTIMARVR